MTAAATVTTFNLRRASLWDGRNAWRYRKACVADAILASDADIVGTQEGLLSMLGELTALLPGYAWIGEGRDGGTRGEHNAIYYRDDRWTPEQSGTFWLSETPNRPGSRSWGAVFPRVCTWAVFRSAEDPSVRLLAANTHLDHVSGKARLNGAVLTAEHVRSLHRQEGIPALLLGDMNALPQSAPMERLRTCYGLRDAYTAYPGGSAAVGPTFHRFAGGARRAGPIDYIFVTDPLEIETMTVDRNRYRGKFPSDHYPVTARLRWTVVPIGDEAAWGCN